ncbi:Acyl-CoA dehydrogenase [Diplonema papillatum]|nr:Acyl-CoA dehydrogenase [Diplonema papillatum]|eukprot:gene14203-21778_t
MSDKKYTLEEVAKHSTAGDLWMVIDGDVYDLSKFGKFHPGGQSVLRPHAGKDASEAFWGLHRAEVLKKYMRLKIGELDSKTKMSPIDRYDPTEPSQVPYGEPLYFQGFRSPFWTESHTAVRKYTAKFVEKELLADAEMFEKQGKYPTIEMYKAMGKAGILAARLGPGPWMKQLASMGIAMPGGIEPEKFDYFHEWMVHAELVKLAAPSFTGGLGDGLVIGLPPVLHFGKGELKERVTREVLLGEKRICLAISEPFAGSDVAGLQTVAKKSPCGKFYIVNGAKKWITNGAFADYFVTAVRTGGKGMFGISMLLIPRCEGVKTTQIPVSYSACAGTAYVAFEDVKVPVENLLGKQNQGFRIIMYNFNHERWGVNVFVQTGMRGMVDECFKWVQQRKAFGKPLIAQPVVRFKLASIIAKVESGQYWLENMTYQMNSMPFKEMSVKLAGPLALLKYQITRLAYEVADDAAQLLGGRGITRQGMGRAVEAFLRTVKLGAILGGSEEIMADLAVRQAMRGYPKHARL